jgi:carbamoyltransferase
MVGRMEFGPRSLGARSILGDPRREETQAVMNLKIKHRESFRPFAPAVLAEKAGEYFELETESPYMLLVAPVREGRRLPMSWEGFEGGDSDDMLEVINRPRSDIPAVTHVDYSARVQTVHAEDKPDFYQLLKEFERQTGCAVLVNTSFNVRGEPIVCGPADAYRCFMRTEMDLLVLEDCLLWKGEQPAFKESRDWRTEYELD